MKPSVDGRRTARTTSKTPAIASRVQDMADLSAAATESIRRGDSRDRYFYKEGSHFFGHSESGLTAIEDPPKGGRLTGTRSEERRERYSVEYLSVILCPNRRDAYPTGAMVVP